MESAGLHELNTKSMADVLGMRARQPGAAVICVMTGRDSRSVRALVPDGKVLDRGFHDVTLVDESCRQARGPGDQIGYTTTDVAGAGRPRHVCFQFELERQRRACKQRFRGTRAHYVGS